MWVFVSFPHFIFFLNPEVDKSQIIIELFILLPTLKSALFKEINLKAAKSADMVLSVENASGHGCFSQIGYRYMNHCSIFLLLSLTLLFSLFVCRLGFLSRFIEQIHTGDVTALTWAAKQLFATHLVHRAFSAVAAPGPVRVHIPVIVVTACRAALWPLACVPGEAASSPKLEQPRHRSLLYGS